MPSNEFFGARAILHIDGDAFFASCEQSRNPKLAGKPVVTGKERGIAASMSYEAKAKGVTRAMPIWEIRKICPEVIYLPSDYETYSLLSERFYKIVRRYTHLVEEYGIDECFADITGFNQAFGLEYEKIAKNIQDDLTRELGFTFSIGLAPNKVLSKIGSKWQKPFGLTVIAPNNLVSFLQKWPVEKIWGIGPATTIKLNKRGIINSAQFAALSEATVKSDYYQPFREIWRELNGELVLPLNLEAKTSYQSIQKFKTFTPPSSTEQFVFAQLSKNIENACIKLRRYNEFATKAVFILRTQDFRHAVLEINLPVATNLPPEILPSAEAAFKKMFNPKALYRATGVVFFKLQTSLGQGNLFEKRFLAGKLTRLYRGADKTSAKYGKHTLFLGTSYLAHKFSAHLGDRGDIPERTNNLLIGETKRRRLGIPMLMGKGI